MKKFANYIVGCTTYPLPNRDVTHDCLQMSLRHSFWTMNPTKEKHSWSPKTLPPTKEKSPHRGFVICNI